MDLVRDQIQSLQLDHESDVGVCRRKSVVFAKKLGFNEIKSGEIAIMVTEMVTNVFKHGGGSGHFMMCRIRDNQNNTGIEIWCCDYGKGISDINKVVKDGYTERSSLGIGLGSIRRFSDEFEVNPEKTEEFKESMMSDYKQYSNCLRSRKWVPRKHWSGTNKSLSIGAASRPKPGEVLNGDSYVVVHQTEHLTVAAVVDGLGHGKEAHIASQLAKEQVILRPDLPLDALMTQIHNSIKGTRGATVGLIRIDTDSNKVYFSGIGNIEGHINSSTKKKNLISYGGIVGHNIRTPRIFEFEFAKGDSICMYSDGITSKWQYEDIDWNESPQKNAENIITKHSRLNDDATILIIGHII